MRRIKFKTANFGIIEHNSGEYEVIEHKAIFETEAEAKAKVDELYEAEK